MIKNRSMSVRATRNVIVEILVQITTYVFSFVVRTIFIKQLGSTYLGINGVMSNILTLLSLTELGFNTALGVSLYRPIKEKDIEKLSALMQWFRKIYLLIGIVVLFIGCALLPFIPMIVGEVDCASNLYVIFVLYIGSSLVTYFSASYTTFITAAQEGYIVTSIKFVSNLCMTAFQVMSLMILQSYYLYLCSIILGNLVGCIITSIYYRKKYSNVRQWKETKLDEKTKRLVFKNTKASLLHKIGGVVLTSTDNLVITVFVNVTVVGYYSNYTMIINIINSMIALIINALAAFVGAVNISAPIEEKTNLYDKIDFFNRMITCFCSIYLIILINPFVELWVGKSYVLNSLLVWILTAQFLMNGIRRTTQLFNMTFGLYDRYQYYPIIEAILNIVISIVLVRIIGLPGVIIGTIVSVLCCTYIAERKVLCRYAVQHTVRGLFKKDAGTIAVFLIGTLASNLLTNQFLISNRIIAFIVRFIICGVISTVVILFCCIMDQNGRWWLGYFKKLMTGKIL